MHPYSQRVAGHGLRDNHPGVGIRTQHQDFASAVADTSAAPLGEAAKTVGALSGARGSRHCGIGRVCLRIPDDLEHGFQGNVNTNSGNLNTDSGDVEHGFRDVEHRFRGT